MEYYNRLYDSIARSEDFLPIVSTTAVGFTMGGTLGAGIGFTLGAVDYLAIKHFEFYDSPYLTYAVLGAGTLSKLKLPYYAAQIVGATVGALIPTGILNDHIDKGTTPISAAIHGYSYAGTYGAGAGFAIGILDESLSALNISSNYYGSTIVKNVAISNLVLPALPNTLSLLPNILGHYKYVLRTSIETLVNTKYLKESVGTALGALESYNAPKPEKWAPLTLAKEMHELYADILNEEELQQIIENRIIISVSSAIVVQSLALSLATHYQNTKSALETFKTNANDAWPNFFNHFQNLAVFFPMYVSGIITGKIFDSFFGAEGLYKIDGLITDEITEDEMMLKLLQTNNVNNTDANTLIKRRYQDIDQLTVKGATLLTDALSSTVKGIYGINYLISVNAQNVIVYSMFYNQLSASLSNWLATKAGSYDESITKLSDKKTSLEEYFRVNADSLVQRNNNDFLRYQLDKCTTDLRIVAGEQMTWSLFHETWSTAKSINDFLISYLMIANLLDIKAISFENYCRVLFTSEDLQPMLAWHGQNAGKIVSVTQSTNRLTELLERMRSHEETHLPEYKYQKIEPGDPWICFDNLEVSAGTTHLVSAEHACIEEDVISVTGESHSGKSTILKLVKGIKHSSASGKGSITFYTQDGSKPIILMASQHYNLPPYTKLLEAITLKPYEEAKGMEDFVIELMQEIKIDSENKDPNAPSLASLLHEEKDWDQYITSGGARKKLMAIWVILSNPDTAILDEIWVGLDREAIQNIQKMFKKYLYNTNFVIVDHEASTHNFDDFYQGNLHVENKTMHINKLHPQESLDPVSNLEYCETQSILMGDYYEGITFIQNSV